MEAARNSVLQTSCSIESYKLPFSGKEYCENHGNIKSHRNPTFFPRDKCGVIKCWRPWIKNSWWFDVGGLRQIRASKIKLILHLSSVLTLPGKGFLYPAARLGRLLINPCSYKIPRMGLGLVPTPCWKHSSNSDRSAQWETYLDRKRSPEIFHASAWDLSSDSAEFQVSRCSP